jgi:hypothetical protein
MAQAIAIGAGTQHRVAEGNGVALAPGHIGALGGTMPRLIGCACPGALAAHGLVSQHQPLGHVPRGARQAAFRAAHEIERADIQRGADRRFRAQSHQFLGEERAGIAVVERAIDVGRGHRDQARGTKQPCALGNDAHGHGVAVAASGDQAFLIRQACHAADPSLLLA